jgi:hypothetical protein
MLWLSQESRVRMRPIRVVSAVSLFVFLAVNSGCERMLAPFDPPAGTDGDLDRLSVYDSYAPAKIDILPLTELVSAADIDGARIDLYVSLLDTFGSQIKSPGIFRFELYEHVQRSAEPKGKRVTIWPDIDLTDPVTNNEYWRDFLRAYEFDLPFEQAGSQNYILQVTCLGTSSKRLSSEFTIKLDE